MWGFTPSIFRHLQRAWVAFLKERGHDDIAEFLIPTIVNTLLANGVARIKVLSSHERGFGVTYPEDRSRVGKRIGDLITRGVYHKRLWG